MDKSAHCKDVYAHFGLALYSAQCLEQAMIHFILMLDHFPKATPEFTTKKQWYEDFDKFIDTENKRTMGQLLGRLQKLGIPCEQLEIKLKEALKKRNWLAHSYFPDRAMEFMNETGRNKMIVELQQVDQFFMRLDEEISAIYAQIANKYGVTDDVLNKTMNELLVKSQSDL